MIFSAGLSSRIGKCGFAGKARQNLEVYTKIQSGLGQGWTRHQKICAEMMVDHLHRYKTLSNFPEKKCMLFCFEV